MRGSGGRGPRPSSSSTDTRDLHHFSDLGSYLEVDHLSHPPYIRLKNNDAYWQISGFEVATTRGATTTGASTARSAPRTPTHAGMDGQRSPLIPLIVSSK